MYKGKFDQKNKASSTDVQELLAQRSSAPQTPPERQRKAAPARDAAAKPVSQSSAKAPSSGKAAPRSSSGANAPARTASQKPLQSANRPAPEPQKKKGPRLGGVIFYTLYFLFILVFFVAVFIGMQWLKGWLVDYQAAQPTVKAEQVFTQLFTDPQWDQLYEASGAQDTAYEGKDAFVEYMNAKVGGSQLTYLETSAGLMMVQFS